MSQLSETFPTLDCSQCILTPAMVEVYQHPSIKLITYSEVEEVDGLHRQLQGHDPPEGARRRRRPSATAAAPARRRAQQEDPQRVRRAAWACARPSTSRSPRRCPTSRSSTARTAPSSRPGQGAKKAACGKCAEVCGREAIDFDQEDTFVTEKVGAIVVATGFQLYTIGKDQPEGLIGLRRVRLRQDPGRHRRPAVRAAGLGLRPDRRQDPAPLRRQGAEADRLPPVHRLARPGQGDRLLLQDLLHVRRQAHHALPATRSTTARPRSSTWTSAPPARATTSSGAAPSRRTAPSTSAAASPASTGRATSSRCRVRHARRASRWRSTPTWSCWPPPCARSRASRRWPRSCRVSYDKHGFFNEAHPKLRPVETNTAGIFLAGACQAPRDIPDTVAMASATAAKVLGLFSKDELEREPIVARVDASAVRRLLPLREGLPLRRRGGTRRSATARATCSRWWPTSTRASARAAAPARPPARRRASSWTASPTSRSAPRSTRWWL